jgi:hypothetical protein
MAVERPTIPDTEAWYQHLAFLKMLFYSSLLLQFPYHTMNHVDLKTRFPRWEGYDKSDSTSVSTVGDDAPDTSYLCRIALRHSMMSNSQGVDVLGRIRAEYIPLVIAFMFTIGTPVSGPHTCIVWRSGRGHSRPGFGIMADRVDRKSSTA